MADERDYIRIAARYADQVISGKIPSCRWVRMACERQSADLDRKDFEFRFDRKRAGKICKFLELLPHVKGKWATKNLLLQPWQCFMLTTIFGWVDGADYRRFRQTYVETPRKNSKTTTAAGIALYLLGPDEEPGSEVYSAATTRDQAKLSWEIARTMVQRTPALRDAYGIEPLAHSIAIERDGRSFKPLSRDADTLEGLNVHGCIIDELHAHKTREVHDVIVSGTGSRRQPLIFKITTAGDNKTGICYEQREYACNILAGRHKDERTFGVIYTVDEEDDWTQRESWAKANPNFGVSVLEDDIATLCGQAEASAESQNNFLTKRLDIWVSVGTAYFNMLAWDRKCAAPELTPEDFYGQPCYIALDLASRSDMAAKVLLFDYKGGKAAFGKYYLPESAIERGKPNYDIYRGWARDGKLTITPGNAIDYEFIERDLLSDMANYEVRQVGVDPHNALQFNVRMVNEGVPIEEIPQNVTRLSDPMKELAAAIVSGKITHNGDPILGWMMGNVVAKKDVKENVYPRKARDENKIDGAVCLIMNFALAAAGEEEIDPYANAAGLRHA